MSFEPGVTSTAATGILFAYYGPALCVVRDGDTMRLPRGTPAADAIVLGELNGSPCFAQLVADDALLPDSELVQVRQLFDVLSEEEFGVAARGLGLTTWDRDHRFCSRCGSATVRSATERVRTCAACGYAAYPRISPAIIVLVERDGCCLLARNARTKSPFSSTLAGFVEVGETLEECVAREVYEEAGIRLADIRYFGSQPWTFTSSLMIGFTARWASGELTLDRTEIFDAAWYAPDALPVVPPKLSIARALIDDFVGRQTN